MNKIFKVIYSKTRHCYVVVSELAKSHCKTAGSHTARNKTALTAAVLLALGTFSVASVFMPMTAEAVDKTKTDGSNFVGVERTDGLFDDKDYANSNGQGAHGDDSITVGLKAIGGDGTITIGDRRAEKSLGSVYVGRGPGMPTGKVLPDKTDDGYWATSVGYQSDATGYGSIAIGSNATANNSYDKDSTGHGITLRTKSGDGKTVVLNGKPDIQRASVAIGYGANADNGNIAIGSYSDASTDLRTAKTSDGNEIKSYLTDKTADSYVSVGKSDALRRISNVADGAADSDVATIGQLKALSDKAGVYNEGWGIKIDKTNGNTISVNHNLGNNMNAQLSSTGLILGGDFSNTYDGKYGGAAGDYAVTLGGESNFALGNISVIAGGYGNHASGKLSFIGGGNNNVATGSYSANLGGTGNTASGESSVVTGGAYNTASGTKSFVGGGYGNIAVGNYSAVIGGWDNRALGNPGGASIATVVGGYQNTANGYHSMVTGGYQNVAWGRDTLVSGGRYNTVLGEMEDGWTQQRLSDASAFGGEGSVVQGLGSVGLAGGSTGKTAYLALAAGYQSVVTDGAAKLEANFSDYGILPVYKDVASAIGYQSTANEAGTISFGHDAGDVSGYTVKWEEDNDPTHDKIDYGSNDYTKVPTVKENHYSDAYYNRLVKVADGIDNHDAVTKEQVQYIGGIYGTDKNDSNYGGKGATGTNSVAIGSNSVAAEDNVVSFGNPDIPAVNIPESQKITHSVSLSDTDKTAINNAVGFDVTKDENWSKISSFKDAAIASSLGSPSYEQDFEKLNNNPEFVKLLKKINNAIQDGTLTYEQYKSFEKYANGTEVETIDAVNIPAKAANYRRVVNMADGINPHDAVAMEQLEGYAKTDASNIGNKITVYKDENGKSVEDTDATTAARNKSKDDWGEALGAGTLASSTAASNSDQLITGKTLYNYDKPVADDGKTLSIVSADKTTGQNLSALDTQVKANTDALTKPNHNIKYYAVDETTLPKLTNFNGKDYSNEKNDGAKGMGSIAAGFNTHADGIASTVTGSYSGVINSGTAQGLDLRGATALSYGTFNINQNTDTGKIFSGVANSIIGQANMTTNSNAAIIYGAGNTVTNSYRRIDPKKAGAIRDNVSDPAKLSKAMQDAVKESGGQVMVMGGGNNVESAYMSQVVGVGNTVTGTDSTYAEDTSTQYNFVDGFQNELTNGKHDYIIGSNNKVSGDSIDKNQSNIVFGDNHKLTNQKNNVIIGSADKKENKNKELTASDATVIGHNADVTVDGGVAIGSGSVSTATAEADAEGYDPVSTAANKASTDTSATWKATTGAVSIGGVNGNTTTTRRITNLAAGFNDTDAVNVAQIKKLANIDASNIGKNYKDGDATANEIAWGEAIGTGTVTKDDNGSKQLVTGGTVYKALHDGGLDKIVIGTPGKDGTAGTPGTIGLVGPAGKDGKNTEVDITIQQGKDDADKGIKGQNGVDGKDGITRIVYGDGDDQHQVATLDDGFVFAGDTGDNAAVKLNHQVKLSGTTFDDSNKYDEHNWTSDNIAVVSDKTDANGDAVLKLQLAKDLKGMNSTEYTSEEKTGEGDQQKTTTTINSKGLTITDGPSITKDGIDAGNKAITQVASGLGNQGSYNKEQNGTNAANLNDVNKMITDAAGGTGTIGKELAKKANVDASNIGENMKDADGNKASTDVIKANKDAWGKAIGTNEIKEGNSQLVTSDAVAKKLDKKADKNSVYTKDETYNRTEIDNKISNISTDVNGKANTSLNNITSDGQNVIKDQARDAVKISNTGLNTSVVATPDATNHTTTYTVNVEGNGKVAAKDMGLISGDTLYNELRPTSDGSYIKQTNTTAQNLVSLDTQVKKTSDLINSDGKTIKIGGSDAATKIDVNGKDGKGRVITGVVSDANDPNSAANVGYVNGLTAANTQQIYRDMNNAYSRLDTNINRAAAGSNALAALHPLDFDPADKASFAVGYGHYRNANAAAVGAFYQPNANTMVNMGISLGNGDPGFNAGVSFKIGKGSAYNGVSKAEMAQTIHDQATEISAIKADDAAKDKRIDALEKENQEMKKQIQEILARLNG